MVGTTTPPPKVLVADRDSLARQAIESFGSQLGWLVELATDPESVLTIASGKTYDVIITDIPMPGVGGMELLRRFQEKNPHQAVIAATAPQGTYQAIEILRSGAVDIIQKPLNFPELERAVMRVVRSLRQRQFEHRAYQFVLEENSCFEFTSADAVRVKMGLTIPERLYHGDKIELNTKLKIDLAFQEALMNSLEHGNLELDSRWKEDVSANGIDKYAIMKQERLNDPVYSDRRIRVTTNYKENVLVISIKDQGRGFEIPKVLLPEIDPENVQCFGRGMGIIAGTMDEVHYEEGGTLIRMVKKLPLRTVTADEEPR